MTLLRPLAAALALLTAAPAALAAGPEVPLGEPSLAAPTPAPAPRRVLAFTIGGGLSVAPDYFGSDDYGVGPDGYLSFDYLRLRNGREFGSADPDAIREGFGLRGAFRFIGERSGDDNTELAGLEDIDAALELGLGVAYTTRNFEAFADVRYGVIGHNAFVGELGADLIVRPSDRLTLTAGPRVLVGSDRYAATYFGVTAAEAAASGLPAFEAGGGLLSAGVELGATYRLNDRWGLYGAVTYDALQNDAEDSPITGLGERDQYGVRIGLTRRVQFEF